MPKSRPDDMDPAPLRTFRLGLLAIVFASALARLAVAAPAIGRVRIDDPDNYLALARSLADGRGFALNGRPTAFRPPLYPIVLAPVVAMLGEMAPTGVAVLHAVLGAGTVALTARAARRWGMSTVSVLIAAAIVAFDPVLLVQSRAAMTEPLAAFLVAATLAVLAGRGTPPRRLAALGGVLFGLSALCRPSLLPGAGLTMIAVLVASPGTWRVRCGRAAILGLATIATLAPWAVRNALVLGEPVWTTTHGGFTLALANNPAYYADVLDGPTGAVWSGPNQRGWEAAMRRETRGMSEPQTDRRLQALALRTIAERPRAFVRASLARLGRFWGIAPSGSVYPAWVRVLTALWTIPLWLAGAAGLGSRDLWRWPRVAAPALVIALSAVHAVYWTDLRMRAPIVPAIALIGAWGVTRWGRTEGVASRPDDGSRGGEKVEIPKN